MTAALLNGITNSLVTAGNAIDRTNLTAGAGIDASQIKPSSGAAGTFGGSVAYTFPLSLVTTVGSNSVVPLTIQGNAGGGQTAAIFQTQLAPAGTVLGQQNPAGDLEIAPLINTVNTLARVTPFYTSAGNGATGTYIGPTLHAVVGTATYAASSGVSITLSGAAVFTSNTSYMVFPEPTSNTVNGGIFVASKTTGSAFNINYTTLSGIAQNTTGTIGWLAIGI